MHQNIWRPGSARIPLGSLSAPTGPLAIVAGHRDRGIRDQDTQGDRPGNIIQNHRCQMLNFQLKMHQKTFGGRVLPGPAGGLKRSPIP